MMFMGVGGLVMLFCFNIEVNMFGLVGWKLYCVVSFVSFGLLMSNWLIVLLVLVNGMIVCLFSIVGDGYISIMFGVIVDLVLVFICLFRNWVL